MMSTKLTSEFEDWLNLLDINAIADVSDKVAECEYFLSLAAQEKDKDKFRWLISAFFGAAYSFFEIQALRAFHDHNPQTGERIENDEALATLRRYVHVVQKQNRPNFVKTSGQHDVTKLLYEFRKENTHHYTLSIMISSQELPEGFQFGNLSGKGVPALSFCREAMLLIQEVERELQQHY